MGWQEEIVRAYFGAWLRLDSSRLGDFFEEDALYTECYGPQYEGLAQIRRWFADWIPHGRVLEWRVNDVFSEGDRTAVDWYFRCVYDGNESGFDGVTLITWSASREIQTLREFESKPEHVRPYSEK